MNAVDMLKKLIDEGYIVPVADQAPVTMPTAYEVVPSITTSGTSSASANGDNESHAKLEFGAQGDSRNSVG